MDCENCKYWESEQEYCTAFECNGLDCPTLPCEEDNNKWKKESNN